MFKSKTTITRPDRGRVVEITRTKRNSLRWAMFTDELRRRFKAARAIGPVSVSPDIIIMRRAIKQRAALRRRSHAGADVPTN